VKSPYQRAVKRMDDVFARFIRRRDTENGYGRCCSSGRIIPYNQGDAGHFINRRWMATRWREDNVHFQSRSDNRFDEGNAAGYALFMLDKYGREHVEYLRALSRETARFTIPEIELLITEYKNRLKNRII